jgi:GTPase SAR1 family protein
MYDITDQSSFHSIDNWYKEAKRSAREDILIILVGNKIDLAPGKFFLFFFRFWIGKKFSFLRVLIFCKCMLDFNFTLGQRRVSADQGRQKVSELGLRSFSEISVKTTAGVGEMLEQLYTSMISHLWNFLDFRGRNNIYRSIFGFPEISDFL